MPADAPELRATERWFIRRGLPMFVEDYSAGRDVWTRAVPALLILFVLLLGGVGDLVDGVLGWVLFSAVVVATLAAYVLQNRRAGRPPFAGPPRSRCRGSRPSSSSPRSRRWSAPASSTGATCSAAWPSRWCCSASSTP